MAQIPTNNGNGIGSSGTTYGSITANGSLSTGNITGAYSIPSPNWSVNYSPETGLTSMKKRSDSADLPAIVLDTYDDLGNPVNMTLAPEAGLSSGDCMKLMMLCISMSVAGDEFSALNYVKANNLERHFKYS